MTINCRIIEPDAQYTLSVRRTTAVQSLPQIIGQAYQQIVQYLQSQGEKPAGPPYAAYYNMDMQNLDVELGFIVARQLPGNGDIRPGEINITQAAEAIHSGPYGSVEPTYKKLLEFIKGRGMEWNGVAYEFYLNDPEVTPPEQLQTRILLPVKKSVG